MDSVVGSKVWFVADCYYPSKSNGEQKSHEAICVLNPGKQDANIEIILYFEDKDCVGGFKAICKSERTNHIRMDKIRNEKGEGVPMDTPYAMMVKSNIEIITQYSRLDTTQAEMALMTTMAFPLT